MCICETGSLQRKCSDFQILSLNAQCHVTCTHVPTRPPGKSSTIARLLAKATTGANTYAYFLAVVFDPGSDKFLFLIRSVDASGTSGTVLAKNEEIMFRFFESSSGERDGIEACVFGAGRVDEPGFVVSRCPWVL